MNKRQQNLTNLMRAEINGLGSVGSDSEGEPLDPARFADEAPAEPSITKRRFTKMDKRTRARAQFLTWLKDTDPEAYREILERAGVDAETGAPWDAGSGLDIGLGQTNDEPTFWQKVASSITSLGTAVIGYKTQKQILEANLQRAEQGLPPLDMTEGAPVVRTQVDVSPEIMAQLQASAGAGMQKLLMFGALGLGAFFLLGGKKRRR